MTKRFRCSVYRQKLV